MRKYLARDLIQLSSEEIWKLPEGKAIVTFDDGDVECYRSHIIGSYYTWWVIRLFPETPFLKEHIYTGDITYQNTITDLLNVLMRLAQETYGWTLDNETICQYGFSYINKLYNDIVQYASHAFTSMNAIDIGEVIYNPEVVEANTLKDGSHASVALAQQRFKDLVTRTDFLPMNPLMNSARQKIVNVDQVIQCVGVRGYSTDVDNYQFRYPNLGNFSLGIDKLYILAQESRTASKALYQQVVDLCDTEYFNRRLQISSMIIEHIYRGDSGYGTTLLPADCGSTEYIDWHIGNDELDNIVGMYRFDEESHTVKPIRSTDTHLKGKVVKLRSPLTCRHLHKYGVCSICYGELSKSIMPMTNVACEAAVETCEQISQNVLGVKHHDKSVDIDGFSGEDMVNIFVSSPTNKYRARFKKAYSQRKGLSLILSLNDAKSLADIFYGDSIDILVEPEITSFSMLGILTVDKDGIDVIEHFALSSTNRKAFLTHDVLRHIQKNGYSPYGKKNIIISMEGFDFDKDVIGIPPKRESVKDFMEAFAKTLETKLASEKRDWTDSSSLSEGLRELFNTVKGHINRPLVHIAILMASILIRSDDKINHDYRLPIDNKSRSIGKSKQLLTNRSFSAAMAFETQYSTIDDPDSTIIRHRPNHPFDHILMTDVGDLYQEYDRYHHRNRLDIP